MWGLGPRKVGGGGGVLGAFGVTVLALPRA